VSALLFSPFLISTHSSVLFDTTMTTVTLHRYQTSRNRKRRKYNKTTKQKGKQIKRNQKQNQKQIQRQTYKKNKHTRHRDRRSQRNNKYTTLHEGVRCFDDEDYEAMEYYKAEEEAMIASCFEPYDDWIPCGCGNWWCF
jgi:hypothetical protein